MRAEIISVGSELLSGMKLNTNAQFLSLELRKIGIDVNMQIAVADNMNDIKKSLSDALGRNNIIILTGGLGPTQDDITKEAVCELLGIKLVADENALEKIKSYFLKKGEKMAQNNSRQALIPEGSLVIKNELGLAVGSILKSGNQCIIMLPGVPLEMKAMFENTVKPFLKSMTGYSAVTKTINVFGMSESLIASALSDLIDNDSPIVATYADMGETAVFISSRKADIKEAISEVDIAATEVERRLGNAVYGTDEPSIHHAVVSQLVSRKLKIATAESCTGGLVAEKITEIPGASFCFEYGVSTYSNSAKVNLLGVLDETLNQNGAVSAETACQMAVGAMNNADSDIAIAVTGYAGPAMSIGEPVGLVYVAVCDRDTVWVKRLDLAVTGKETRNQIRELACKNAFDMVRKIINGIAIFNAQQLPVYEIANSIQSKDKAGSKAIFKTNKTKATKEKYDPMPNDNSFKAKLVRFFYNLVPNRNDEMPEKVRKSVFLTSAVALFITVCYILSFFMGISKNQNMYTKLEALKEQKPSASVSYPSGYLEDFALLYSKNKDIAGWIEIEGTGINYPVLQTNDNEFYANHNFYGKKERHGVPYVDFRNDIKDLNLNTVIYGHNMKSDNQMFSELENYYKGSNAINYYRKHPLINFDTVYKKMQWKIFAVFTANTNRANGKTFEYNMIDAHDMDEYNEFISEVKKLSIYNIPVDVKSSDKILTLSTNYYEYEGQRLVIMARLVRENENPSVDVNAVTHNKGGTDATSSKDETSSSFSRPSYTNTYSSSSNASTSSKASSEQSSSEELESQIASSEEESSSKAESEESSSEAESEESSSEAESEESSSEAESEEASSEEESSNLANEQPEEESSSSKETNQQ